uniref:SWIM-type domain-containing protein n=1 Tax=Cyprinus carpio carpio TaxID=630221 RepID=A0A8C1CNC2_CYPCA
MCRLISAIMKMALRDSEPVVLVNSSCSCVAGSGMCNHLVALLYQTAHYYESGMSVVPPVLSCTQTEQKWHKPRTMGVKPGPVDAMVVVKPKPGATSASGIRSSLYKAYSGELPDPSTLDPKAVYADFKPGSLPLICTMNLSPDKPLVESIFGKVQAGSILSYQHPPPTPDGFITHKDAPPFPKVPPEGYQLKPTDCKYVPTNQEQLHLHSLSVTLLQSHLIEEATRCQSAAPEWHSLRKERVTASNFREVSHVRGPNAAENLAERIIRGTRQTTHMKRGLDMEAGALKDYATLKNLNLRKCGLVIHPDAPWLGASPDGLVYDPLERPSFGLVEMKCPNALSYIDCRYLRVDHGTYKLKESHAYYWQVQGQLLMTGMEWCDFVVCAHDDMFVQRIYRDTSVLSSLKQRCDLFFFFTYLPKYLSMHK